MTKLIMGDERPCEAALKAMRDAARPETEWYAYQAHDLSSSTLGDLRFLQVGKDCTFEEPPARYPDSKFGLGWRFLLVGKVNLKNGVIEAL